MNFPKQRALVSFAGILFLLSFGCTSDEMLDEIQTEIMEETPSEITAAMAVLNPTEGTDTEGKVRFSKTENGIQISAEISGLTAGKHGIHIHRLGDCSTPDASSAGWHFNPENMPHGAPTDAERHVGDLGNLVAENGGTVRYEWEDSVITFTGEHSIIGRSVIVHSGEDDFRSQPTGNAGSRLACGVIGIVEDTFP
jgi:Cu-Zn family superoxide dismutase